MDPPERLEIYIPVEAEVKNIKLCSLPKSVLRRMGLSQSDSEGSRKLAESPVCVWICPAVLRKKGEKPPSHAGNILMENESSQFWAGPGPFQMSFVSSNFTAYSVLKNTMPGKKIPADTSHTSLSALGSAPQTHQDAVVIYQGCIYLSIRKPSRRRSQQETREASQSSTSDVSSKSQKKSQSPQASVEPAGKKAQRKRRLVTFPEISPKQAKNLLTKADHSTTNQELLNDSRPKKGHTTCEETHRANRKGAKHNGGEGSSSKTARSVPQSSGSAHTVESRSHNDARGEQAAEEAAGPEPAWFQLQGEQEDLYAETASQSSDMNSNIEIDSGDPDYIVGIVEQSSNQSWTRRECPGRTTSLHEEFDFKELAQEEKIAQMMAKLRQNEAALNNLPSS